MNNCQQGRCLCVPEKLVRQILRHPIAELDLQGTTVWHVHNLIGLRHMLQHLHLAHNCVTDVAPLGQLTALRTLDLTANRIDSVTTLQNLVALEQLRLASNLLQNFDLNLAALPGLYLLDLSYNKLIDLAPLTANIQGSTSLVNLSLLGNQFKHYSFPSGVLQILDGAYIGPCGSQTVSQLHRIIAMQEHQLLEKVGSRFADPLQAWRKAVFKELLKNKTMQLLIRQHLTTLDSTLTQHFKALVVTVTNKLTEKHQRLALIKKSLLNRVERLRNKYVGSRELLVKASYFLQSLNGASEFVADPNLVMPQLKIVKSTLDEVRKQRTEVTLQLELLRQEHTYTQQQLEEARSEVLQMKRDADRLEQVHRAQDAERVRTINELRGEIKTLHEVKLRETMHVQERQGNEEMQMFTLRQQHEQEISSLKYDNQLLSTKLRTQQDESKLRLQKLQEKYEQQMRDQEEEFTKLYAEVKADYELKSTQRRKVEERLNGECFTLKQELSELRLRYTNLEHERDGVAALAASDRLILETQMAKSLNDWRLQQDAQQKQHHKRIEEEKQLLKQELTDHFEKEKADLFRLQEDSHQEKVSPKQQTQVEALLQDISDMHNQKRQSQQQNADLLRIIQLKDEMIKQLQSNLVQYRNTESRKPTPLSPEKLPQEKQEKLSRQPVELLATKDRRVASNKKAKVGTIYTREEIYKKAEQILSDSD